MVNRKWLIEDVFSARSCPRRRRLIGKRANRIRQSPHDDARQARASFGAAPPRARRDARLSPPGVHGPRAQRRRARRVHRPRQRRQVYQRVPGRLLNLDQGALPSRHRRRRPVQRARAGRPVLPLDHVHRRPVGTSRIFERRHLARRQRQ